MQHCVGFWIIIEQQQLRHIRKNINEDIKVNITLSGPGPEERCHPSPQHKSQVLLTFPQEANKKYQIKRKKYTKKFPDLVNCTKNNFHARTKGFYALTNKLITKRDHR